MVAYLGYVALVGGVDSERELYHVLLLQCCLFLIWESHLVENLLKFVIGVKTLSIDKLSLLNCKDSQFVLLNVDQVKAGLIWAEAEAFQS